MTGAESPELHPFSLNCTRGPRGGGSPCNLQLQLKPCGSHRRTFSFALRMAASKRAFLSCADLGRLHACAQTCSPPAPRFVSVAGWAPSDAGSCYEHAIRCCRFAYACRLLDTALPSPSPPGPNNRFNILKPLFKRDPSDRAMTADLVPSRPGSAEPPQVAAPTVFDPFPRR